MTAGALQRVVRSRVARTAHLVPAGQTVSLCGGWSGIPDQAEAPEDLPLCRRCARTQGDPS